ncbi:hypothetical protein C8Q79DRAFT_28493 [Trametes meyenii]|nr:hypothetical protein C8Q79DRAFT_28493 [Trametes meyenii]
MSRALLRQRQQEFRNERLSWTQTHRRAPTSSPRHHQGTSIWTSGVLRGCVPVARATMHLSVAEHCPLAQAPTREARSLVNTPSFLLCILPPGSQHLRVPPWAVRRAWGALVFQRRQYTAWQMPFKLRPRLDAESYALTRIVRVAAHFPLAVATRDVHPDMRRPRISLLARLPVVDVSKSEDADLTHFRSIADRKPVRRKIYEPNCECSRAPPPRNLA